MFLHLNELEFPSPRDALCRNWLKLTQWFWRRFFNFVYIFSLLQIYFPLKRRGGLHLNKHDSPSCKNVLCQVWLKLDQWFWRSWFLYIADIFSLFHNYLPLERWGPSFEYTRLPLTQRCIVLSLVEIVPVVLV